MSNGLQRNYIKVDGDVYSNYRWAINSHSQTFIKEVPIITLREYGLNHSKAMANIREIASKAKDLGGNALKYVMNLGDPKESYVTGLYNTTDMINLYKLPFFSEYNHVIQNTWTNAVSMFISQDKAEMFLSNASSTFLGYGSILKRKEWDSTTPASMSFSFTLYNTYDEKDIVKNFNFLRGLINNNLTERTGVYTLIPPAIYEVHIPGVRYSPASCIQNLTVENIGQINRKRLNFETKNSDKKVENGFGWQSIQHNDVEINVPDAWKVQISILDLLPETSNMLDSAVDKDHSKVKVIAQGDDILSKMETSVKERLEKATPKDTNGGT